MEYQQAVDDLVQSELGQLIMLRMERTPRPKDFYIKPKPIDDTYNNFDMNSIDVTPNQYEKRYKSPVSTAITLNMKKSLIKGKHVDEANFNTQA